MESIHIPIIFNLIPIPLIRVYLKGTTKREIESSQVESYERRMKEESILHILTIKSIILYLLAHS